jgi:deoxyhypusine synthase
MTNCNKKQFLAGKRIAPPPISKDISAADLIDQSFLAYNGARLREGAHLLTERMLEPDVTVALTLTGALTPAGLGMSALIPLVEAGYVDWIVSTGANLYHDTHFALDLSLHQGTHQTDDAVLFDQGVVRIYDIFFDYKVLLDTDLFFREIITGPEFQRTMSTAEFHWLCGKYIDAREKALGIGKRSFLAACYRADVPVYTSSPGDSSIGMNIAAKALEGNKLLLDTNADVNETASIVLNAKKEGGKSGCWILGGGSPKNFLLQTEPQIQEVLGILEQGHDFFLQITDARPDTGGLSGATPSEAVSWGKVDPSKLPDTVVCYLDTTVALPLLTAYSLARHEPRSLKRLYKKRGQMMAYLIQEFKKSRAASQNPERPADKRKKAEEE